jgi:hypothetical protein
VQQVPKEKKAILAHKVLKEKKALTVRMEQRVHKVLLV